jgi:hypothetical protein
MRMEAELVGLPRGVRPDILLEQVKNTAPFLFDLPAQPYIKTLTDIRTTQSLSHPEYFRLCLSAHWATVGTFVPTDVDNQIRHKLWHPALSKELVLEMAKTVHESHDWDFRPVTTRWVQSPVSGELLGGHHGEWFSVSIAAYAALRRRDPDAAAEMARAVLEELAREAAIFQDLRKARDGVGMLKAATLIAHNLGDLDRVMDMWNLAPTDALRVAAYKTGHPPEGTQSDKRFQGILVVAGKLNKAYMADENHRHFALREPRCLRRSPDFLLGIGPFFDEWGMKLARHPQLTPEEVGEVAQALISGWERLSGTVGYARALAGILENFPGGLNRLSEYLPAKQQRVLKAGPLRNLCAIGRRRFEEQRGQVALQFVTGLGSG